MMQIYAGEEAVTGIGEKSCRCDSGDYEYIVGIWEEEERL